MGYRIEYGETIISRNTLPDVRKNGTLHLTWILAGVAVAAIVFTALGNRVRNMLIPGDPEITIPAFSEFVDCVQEGMPFSEALTEFCLEIVNGAEIS